MQHAFCVSIDFICSMYVRLVLIIMIPRSMYLLIKLSLSLLYQRLQCCLVISLYPHCCSAPYTFTYDACKPVTCNNKCTGEGGCLVSGPFSLSAGTSM